MSGARIAAALAAAAALGFFGFRFFSAAHDSAARTRSAACRALQPDSVPAALKDREAPDFELADATGKKVSLRSLRGRPVLLNFWATWCPPCVDEVPSLEDLAKRLEKSDAVLLAVSVDDDWNALRRFFPQGSKMSVVLDTTKEVPKKYGTDKFPETYLVKVNAQGEGQILYHFVNKRDWGHPAANRCIEAHLPGAGS